ncbi:arylesterase [Jeongeupia chitinilytica]|uniref:Arylesterase n=2 Tax=Jeongeupia chitinilytica TaxID=1041641 RepID=A0ABQ3GVZ2_9NEIS|nr:arylesterase [Jeongeupia chitinilytica]
MDMRDRMGKVWGRMLLQLTVFCGIALLAGGAQAAKPVLLVFGDSLSAGYGIAANQAWPVRLESLLSEKGKPYTVVNASVSGETTDGGLTRFPQALKIHKPRLVIIELGANDGLRGLPVAKARSNLGAMIAAAQKTGARVHLVGMQMPPNYGPDYTRDFAAMYPALAKQYRAGLTPFLLAPVINRPDWFQPDQLHPVADAQPAIAAMIARDLAPLL